MTLDLVRLIFTQVPGYAAVSLVLIVLLGLVQGVSILLLVPLLSLAGVDVGTGSVGQLGEVAIGIVRQLGLPETLLSVLGLFIGLQVVFHLLQYVNERYAAEVSNRVAATVREDLYGALTGMEWVEFQRMRPARLAHALTDEAHRVGAAAYSVLTLVATAGVVGVFFAIAFAVQPLLTVFVAAVAAGLLVGLRRFNRRVRAEGEAMVARYRQIYDATLEWLGAMKLLKGLGPAHRGQDEFTRQVRDLARVQTAAVTHRATSQFWLRTGVVLVLALVVVLGLGPIGMPVGALVLMLYLFARLTPMASTTHNEYQTYLHFLPSLETVAGLRARAHAAREPAGRPWEPTLERGIVLQDVRFAYPEGEHEAMATGEAAGTAAGTAAEGLGADDGTAAPHGPTVSGPAPAPTPGTATPAAPPGRDGLDRVLGGEGPTAGESGGDAVDDAEDVEDAENADDDRGTDDAPPAVLDDLSIAIPARSITLLSGPSGAGKSTLADIVMGLVTPQEGRVLVDGEPLTPERRATWRRWIGYVPQEPFLLNDTIRANLRWAAPGAEEQAMRDALEEASAGFVHDLPEGLDTVVGTRGGRLSGGERQRVALAMALVRRPKLLVLDEVTSDLDPANEARVLDVLDRVKEHATVLLISHRRSMRERMDAVYVLSDGQVRTAEGDVPDVEALAGPAGPTVETEADVEVEFEADPAAPEEAVREPGDEPAPFIEVRDPDGSDAGEASSASPSAASRRTPGPDDRALDGKERGTA